MKISVITVALVVVAAFAIVLANLAVAASALLALGLFSLLAADYTRGFCSPRLAVAVTASLPRRTERFGLAV
jgi:hypothetical protein